MPQQEQRAPPEGTASSAPRRALLCVTLGSGPRQYPRAPLTHRRRSAPASFFAKPSHPPAPHRSNGRRTCWNGRAAFDLPSDLLAVGFGYAPCRMMTSPGQTRAVLARTVDRDGVDDAFSALGYRLVNVIPIGPGRPSQLVFARNPNDYVHVVDDRQLGLTYLAVQGSRPDAMKDELERRLSFDSVEEAQTVLERARTETPPAVEALVRGLAVLVLLQPDAPTFTEHVMGALRHDDPRLRAAGLAAAAYAPREELRAMVVTVRDADPEPSLRDAAARVTAGVFGGAA